jgi:hypothetical protein
MAEATTVSRRAREQGYEPEDIRVRGVLIVAAASLVLLVLILLALWGMVGLFAESYPRPLPTALEAARVEPPPPRLQSAPKDDLSAFRAQEEAILNRWAWIDRSAGIVQIPIDQAMALLTVRGWPQPDRPAGFVPPRAAGPQDGPASEEKPAPGGSSSGNPPMSTQEVGPAQAIPEGGPR